MNTERHWTVNQDDSNALEIRNAQGEKMCELISDEDNVTDDERALMRWICAACNAYEKEPPEYC